MQVQLVRTVTVNSDDGSTYNDYIEVFSARADALAHAKRMITDQGNGVEFTNASALYVELRAVVNNNDTDTHKDKITIKQHYVL